VYTQDEKTWAALAHATILLALLSAGPLGPIAAFLIWLIKKEQSAYVGFQALQSLVYQIALVVLNWVMWIGIALLTAVIVGCLCIPIGLAVSLGTIVYGCYAAYECSLGHDFRYVIIGDMLAERPTAPSGPPTPPAVQPPTPPAEPPATTA
jgi:uncharacterized Tic20 family protein